MLDDEFGVDLVRIQPYGVVSECSTTDISKTLPYGAVSGRSTTDIS